MCCGFQVCDELTFASSPLCEQCAQEPQLATAVLMSRLSKLQRQFSQLRNVCMHCGGSDGRRVAEYDSIVCQSLDCGIYFDRKKLAVETATAEILAAATCNLL